MKSHVLFNSPVNHPNKYPNRIDEIIERDWRQKAAKLQERRWKKINTILG